MKRFLPETDHALYANRSRGPREFDTPLSSQQPSSTEPLPPPSLLVEYYRTIVRHRALIGILAVCGVLLSVLLHLGTQPVYRTRTSLDIQSLNTDFMNERAVDPTAATSSEDTNIQTQIKLLQSDSLMERVQQRLMQEPHPAFIDRGDLISRARRALHLGGHSVVPFPALLGETAKGVKVKSLGVTRLIEVTCDSWDPAFAAHFCNTLTSEYQNEDLESRGMEAKRTSDWLMHQAADIRQKAEDSEKRLVAATGGNGLILSQEQDTVGEDHLRQLQGELVKAQADRMEKEAELNVARTAAPDSVPGVLDNPAYASAQAKLADLEGKVAALVPPLTEENPRVIHLRSQIKEAEADMARARTTSLQRLQDAFEGAKHREDLLAMAYNSQESTVSSDLQKGSQVNLLRREVESEQQLYQTLLQRAKEAGFASAMQASTIRVVDEARKPRAPIYPQRLTAAIVGFLLGSIAGIAIAFFKDRNSAVMRVPGESERYLQIEELGVVPSSLTGSPLFPPFALPRSAAFAPRKLPVTLAAVPAQPQSVALQTARWDDAFSIVAEAYRNITLSILHRAPSRRTQRYIVSSASAGEGKTTVTSNLGVALSKANLRVILIDGDLRKPTLHRSFAVDNSVGLRDILRGEVDLAKAPVSSWCQATGFPRLSVIPSGLGREQVVELLHSARFGELLDHLAASFDVILVDTPPILHIADARILARQTEGAILILRSGVTTREQAMDARDVLDRDRVPVIGTILNDFNPAREGKYGYYKSYYAYQQNTESEDRLVANL
jgi:capsular exopolysaccharide synthesis family protein